MSTRRRIMMQSGGRKYKKTIATLASGGILIPVGGLLSEDTFFLKATIQLYYNRSYTSPLRLYFIGSYKGDRGLNVEYANQSQVYFYFKSNYIWRNYNNGTRFEVEIGHDTLSLNGITQLNIKGSFDVSTATNLRWGQSQGEVLDTLEITLKDGSILEVYPAFVGSEKKIILYNNGVETIFDDGNYILK